MNISLVYPNSMKDKFKLFYNYYKKLKNELEELKKNEIDSEARKISLAKTKDTFESQLREFKH